MPEKPNNSDVTGLLKEVELKLGWGPSKQWHSSMFDELTAEVYKVTGVQLSAATLKRLFGTVKHEGAPSITTLDTLSRFLGFENWRAFRVTKKSKFKLEIKDIPYRSVYVTLGFVLAMITVMLIANKRPVDQTLPEGITFSSRPVTTDFPNSVVFDFNLQGVQSDSLHIQQYWDVTKTILIDKDQKQATGIYYFPGYFRAKLMVDGQPVKEHDLFLKSDGWLGTVEYEPIPKYFEPVNKGERLTHPETLVAEIKATEQPLVSAYQFIDDLGEVSGDNFSLKVILQNTYNDKWAVCQSAWIYVIGTTGAMVIPFTKVGCSSDISIMLNDVYLSGKENDLSSLGVDLSEPTALGIEVRNQNVSLTIKDQLVFEKAYSEPIGRFVGMKVKFLGLGEIHAYSVFDQNGEEVSF